MTNTITPAMAEKVSTALNARMNSDFTQVKDSLIIRPLKNDPKDLKDIVHAVHGDIALVLYQLLILNDENLMTSRIHTDELHGWHQDTDTIMQKALAQTAARFPASMLDYKSNLGISPFQQGLTKEEILNGHAFVMLSNDRGTNGALSLFYPGVRERFLSLFGGPFHAVFMNTTDVMLFPEGTDRSLLEHFRQVGMEPGPFGEPLSDHIWICDENGIRPE